MHQAMKRTTLTMTMMTGSVADSPESSVAMAMPIPPANRAMTTTRPMMLTASMPQPDAALIFFSALMRVPFSLSVARCDPCRLGGRSVRPDGATPDVAGGGAPRAGALVALVDRIVISH